MERNLRRLSDHVIPRRMGLFVQRLGIVALRNLVLLTPVDTGQARAGWNVGINGVNTRVNAPSKTGASVIRRGASVIKKVGSFQNLYISNAVRHAAILDQGGFVPRDPGPSKDPRPGRLGRVLVSGGFSIQAPHGMMRRTVRILRAEIGQALRAVGGSG
jgi:hypothetical protein